MKMAAGSIKEIAASDTFGLVEAPCVKMSRAAGLHAPGRELAEKATLPRANQGGEA